MHVVEGYVSRKQLALKRNCAAATEQHSELYIQYKLTFFFRSVALVLARTLSSMNTSFPRDPS